MGIYHSLNYPDQSQANSQAADLNHQDTRKVLRELAASKAQLEEDRVRTQALIDSLGEGLIVMDENGKITRINPYTLRALGFTEADLLGKWFPRTIIAVDQHSRPLDHLDRAVIRSLTSGQAVSEHSYYLRKDGSVIPVFVTVSPILLNERPVGAIEIFRDITKEKQLDIAKDEFVSLASHQLRTPATGVKAILSMLLSEDFGPLSPIQKKYLGKALKSNDRQLDVIEDLLHVAHIDSGHIDLQLEVIDLVGLLQELTGELIVQLRARRQKLELQTPNRLLARVDQQKVRMVVDNLISNASKYTPAGGAIAINLQQENNQIVLVVRDNGIGIAEADQAKLFTKFSRVENELSDQVGGTGLGLYLVKRIIDLHQGTIRVQSAPNKGASFIITLPGNQEDSS